MLTTILMLLIGWVLTSIPVGLLVGRILAHNTREIVIADV
jgi:glycerol-3-phosphate acyltransferase PlsY